MATGGQPLGTGERPISARRPAVPPYPPMQLGPWRTFAHAWNGLIHTIVHQRNMRFHMLAALLVGLVGSGIPLGLAEKVTLIFCVLFVFFAEILNSALEQLVDLTIQQFDEKARISKDAAAAAVLVLTFGTVVIFSALLVHNWQTISTRGPQIARQVAYGVPLALCHWGLLAARRKPVWLDVLFFAGASAFLAGTLKTTESWVFSSLTYAVVVVAGASAILRRREAAAAATPQA